MSRLLPDTQDLQGFVRLQSASPPLIWKPDPTNAPESGARGSGNIGVGDARLASGRIGYRERKYVTTDNKQVLGVTLYVYDDYQTTRRQFEVLQKAEPSFSFGTYRDKRPLGDVSWIRNTERNREIIFRYARILARITDATPGTARPLPGEALDSMGYLVLLHAIRHGELTGIPTQTLTLTVNGTPVRASAMGAQLFRYVPADAFAEAAGIRAAWDPRSGQLELARKTGPKLLLRAGQPTAHTGSSTQIPLEIPLLKDGDTPIAELRTLLRLFQGVITSGTSKHLEVRI